MKNINELKAISEQLKFKNSINIQDDIFELFIDNKIDAESVAFLYKENGLHLPEEFLALAKDKQKRYRQHKQTKIAINEDVQYYTSAIYNKNYFYDLVEASKKNKHITRTLIKYINELENIPLFIIGMQNLKIKNLDKLSDSLKSYALDNHIIYFYDLFMDLNTKNDQMKLEKIYKFFDTKDYLLVKSDEKLNLDLNYFYVEFALFIEELLYTYYDRKIANTIKYKFLVYKKEYLKEKDYIQSRKNGIELLKKHFNNNDLTLLKNFKKYTQKNNDKIDELPPNGYTAIYYSISRLEEII